MFCVVINQCCSNYNFTFNSDELFLISNLRRVLNAVCFLLGNYSASEFYMLTFRNILSVASSQAGRWEELFHSSYLPAYEDVTVCSETSAYKIQTPGNYPEECTTK